MGLRSLIANKIRKSKLSRIELELERIEAYPRFTDGYANVFDKPFKFHDSLSFVMTYREIFINGIYAFKSVAGKNVILDCGANMGLGTLYFALNYPDHTIYAFEPDHQIHQILKENVETNKLSNVILRENAVWDKEEILEFYGDMGMGSRANTPFLNQKPTRIEAVRLQSYLTPMVDFLKMDIEGAEDVVLRDCKGSLQHLGSLFFEYHNDINKDQTLHQLLELVKDSGFNYYVKESWTRSSPFIDRELIGENFDMAINIFCYK